MSHFQLKSAPLTLIAILTTSTAHALTVPKANLDDLVVDAPTALIGTVVGQHFRTYGNDNMPYTRYSLRVHDVVYGKEELTRAREQTRLVARNDEIPLAFFGGLGAGNRMTRVIGSTELAMGKTYLLFLRGGRWTLDPVAGWNQGAFQLVAAGPELGHVVLSLNGDALMGVEGSELVFQTPDFTQQPNRQQERSLPGEGGARLDGDLLPKAADREQRKDMSAEEELAAERERQDVSGRRDIEREKRERIDRRQQLQAWLGDQPMSLKAFLELIEKRRAELAERVPEDKRSLSLDPQPPHGRGMEPAKSPRAAN